MRKSHQKLPMATSGVLRAPDGWCLPLVGPQLSWSVDWGVTNGKQTWKQMEPVSVHKCPIYFCFLGENNPFPFSLRKGAS